MKQIKCWYLPASNQEHINSKKKTSKLINVQKTRIVISPKIKDQNPYKNVSNIVNHKKNSNWYQNKVPFYIDKDVFFLYLYNH